MKAFLSLALVGFALIAFTSCEKCYNCTYTGEGDAVTNPDTSVCGKGKVINDQIDLYERQDWKCNKD